MDYGDVLLKAGRIVWKHKILWLFGLLAGCAAGRAPNLNLNYSFNAGDFANNPVLPGPLQNFLMGLQQMIRQTPYWIFGAVALLICGLAIVFWLIGMYGRTGLAQGSWQADEGAERLDPGMLARESLHKFWKVTLASLLTGLPGFAIGLLSVVMVIFGIAGLAGSRSNGAAVLLICLAVPFFCILVPIFYLLGVWGELSTVAIVGEGLGVIDGLKRGWHFFTRRFGSVLLFALLVFIAQIAFGVLTALVFAPLGIGVILGTLATRGNVYIGPGLIVLALLVLLPIALFLGSLFHSYIGTVWALVFRRLAAAEIQAPVVPVPPVSPYPQSSDFPPPSAPVL